MRFLLWRNRLTEARSRSCRVGQERREFCRMRTQVLRGPEQRRCEIADANVCAGPEVAIIGDSAGWVEATSLCRIPRDPGGKIGDVSQGACALRSCLNAGSPIPETITPSKRASRRRRGSAGSDDAHAVLSMNKRTKHATPVRCRDGARFRRLLGRLGSPAALVPHARPFARRGH